MAGPEILEVGGGGAYHDPQAACPLLGTCTGRRVGRTRMVDDLGRVRHQVVPEQ